MAPQHGAVEMADLSPARARSLALGQEVTVVTAGDEADLDTVGFVRRDQAKPPGLVANVALSPLPERE